MSLSQGEFEGSWQHLAPPICWAFFFKLLLQSGQQIPNNYGPEGVNETERHFLGILEINVKGFVHDPRFITILLVMVRFVLNFENLCGHAKVA